MDRRDAAGGERIGDLVNEDLGVPEQEAHARLVVVLGNRRIERQRDFEGARTDPLPGCLQAGRGSRQSGAGIEGRQPQGWVAHCARV